MRCLPAFGGFLLMLLACSQKAGPHSVPRSHYLPLAAEAPKRVELNAAEMLAALDSFSTRGSSSAWVDRMEFGDSCHDPSLLSEDQELLSWANEREITLAFRGLVDLDFDRTRMRDEIEQMIKARGSQKGPEAVVLTVNRIAASPRLLVCEITQSGDRYSEAYFVIWRRLHHRWLFHDIHYLWIACG